MHTAVIGGTGLIGLATVQALRELGCRATIISRRSPTALAPATPWVQGDIRDAGALRTLLEKIAPDNVVHLAALLQFDCEERPATAVEVNINGTLNVLEACRGLAIRRIVFGSSIAAYGERTDVMREDDPPSRNIGLYGATKRLGEMLGIRYASLYGVEFIALRYAGIFGPGRSQSRGMSLVRQMLKDTATGQNVRIDDASGEEWGHFTHVTDAAAATVRALQHPSPSYSVYNVGGPPQNYAMLKDFYAAVRKVAPHAGSVTWAGKGRSSGRLDTTRLVADLGVTPSVTLSAGLELDIASQ